MKRSYPPGLYALCGGTYHPGRVTHAVDPCGTLVVVGNVGAEVCDQCNEPWLEDTAVARLERIVDGARAREVQVEVMSL